MIVLSSYENLNKDKENELVYRLNENRELFVELYTEYKDGFFDTKELVRELGDNLENFGYFLYVGAKINDEMKKIASSYNEVEKVKKFDEELSLINQTIEEINDETNPEIKQRKRLRCR